MEDKVMEKIPFVTKEKVEEIVKTIPTPFHIYDEKGIRENAQKLKDAFAWNKGFKEFFAVKATPNPFLIDILREYGCGCDCSSLTELMLSHAMGVKGGDIMFSSNDTPAEEFAWMISHILIFLKRQLARFLKQSAAVIIPVDILKSVTASWIIREMRNME